GSDAARRRRELRDGDRPGRLSRAQGAAVPPGARRRRADRAVLRDRGQEPRRARTRRAAPLLAVLRGRRQGRRHGRGLAAGARGHRRHRARRRAPLARARPHPHRARMIGRGRRLAACLGLAALALTACGKKSPPVAPEQRAPQPVADLTAVVDESAIVLTWTPPNRRVDNTRQRDLTVMRVFRVEDSGAGEPKSAMLSDGRIAGYDELAAIRSAEPEPAVRRGPRLAYADSKGLAYGRRYTYVVVTGDSQGRIGPAPHRGPGSDAAPPAAPENVAAQPGERSVRVTWSPATRLLDGSAVADPITYEVLRAPSADADLAPVSPQISDTALTDSNLENDRDYFYAVRAVRTAGGTTLYGRPSAPAVATPPALTPPPPPPTPGAGEPRRRRLGGHRAPVLEPEPRGRRGDLCHLPRAGRRPIRAHRLDHRAGDDLRRPRGDARHLSLRGLGAGQRGAPQRERALERGEGHRTLTSPGAGVTNNEYMGALQYPHP